MSILKKLDSLLDSLILFLFDLPKKIFQKKEKYYVSIYFGVPGSGKTTLAAILARRDLRRKKRVWSNVPITGSYVVDPHNDFGKYDIYNGRVIIDEAGLDYNNRNFKRFSDDENYFFKYHRHNRLNIDIFSQSYEDMDKKIRLLGQRYYVVKPFFIPGFVMRLRISKKVGISEQTHDIIDDYYFVPWYIGGVDIYYCRNAWKLFNSYSRRKLPSKKWEKW